MRSLYSTCDVKIPIQKWKNTNKKKACGKKISGHSLDVLLRWYTAGFTPNAEQRFSLSQDLDLTPIQIKNWFYNKKRNEKKLKNNTLE
ncbi:hypothetical protein [Acanthamoeba polyphaga mimivirus]|uniref:Homeobox domain-containing protein n=3 Tax=Megamimivirinae TaxID=3044648 RepID=A0A2L2DLL3_MIMIV|nr:hypothetical protein MegaChil _gp0180 [Megavirus chiliensis]AEQ33178.1 homeobox domain-containing protein [Megavirus chiliensis]AFX92210.1 hypothetical protein CE11_00180 [Megavirus courdo11]AVG45914.1 hypothetical protein [Acanthamoeba polyphaga mimivirus]AVG47017.1 hypothetical protein [Acanthamoeba polyphaga mimivirus]